MKTTSFYNPFSAMALAGILFFSVSCSETEDQLVEPANVESEHMRGKDMGSSIMRTFTATLAPLNNSGVTGEATITVESNTLTVEIWAEGLEANRVHPQHIHGFADSKKNSTCPGPAADTNGDGLIDLVEGLPSYGGVLVELYLPVDEFPVADADGKIHYKRSFALGEVAFEEEGQVISYHDLKPLQNRTIVLHGMTVDGQYIATLPVACGQIKNSN
jgi:hypothetical protein